MATKWYIKSTYSNTILKVECIKETEKQAVVLIPHWDKTIHERRMNKEGTLFDSFIEAKKYLIDLSNAEIAQLQSRLDLAKAGLKKRNDIPHP